MKLHRLFFYFHKMEIKNVSILLFSISIGFVVTSPIDSNANHNNNNNHNVNNNDNLSTVLSDEVTAYPEMQKFIVDLGNVSPDVSDLLRKSKMDVDQVLELQERLRNQISIENDKNRYDVIASSTAPAQISQDNENNYRLLKIKSELKATLRADNTDPAMYMPTSKIEKAQFEYAFAAACEIPRQMNISRWFDGKTWNIMFKPIYRRYNVLSSTIRLYKIKRDDDTSVSNECDPEEIEMYTIVVSVYVRKRKEIKKKTIFTTVIQSSYVGWVEIDALGTLQFWDQAKNNHGIAVDIYNENEDPLDTREHFRLQSCNDQAVAVLPWNAYEFLVKQSTGTVSNPVVEKLRQMHSYPRLDLVSRTPPIYDTPKTNSNNDHGIQNNHSVENNRPQRHIRHENHHKHHAQYDNTATTFKKKFHKRREHSHRDGNSATG